MAQSSTMITKLTESVLGTDNIKKITNTIQQLVALRTRTAHNHLTMTAKLAKSAPGAENIQQIT